MTTQIKDFNVRKSFTVAKIQIIKSESSYPDID
jgi:hypothetical protein